MAQAVSEPKAWQCPACMTWLAPHVNEHRCAPPEGGVSVRPVVAPYSPSTGTATWPAGSGIVVTPGGGYSYGEGGGGGGATQWVPPGGVASVRVTAANAGAWRDGTLRLAPGEYRPACNPYGDCGHNSCAVLARPGLALVTDPAA